MFRNSVCANQFRLKSPSPLGRAGEGSSFFANFSQLLTSNVVSLFLDLPQPPPKAGAGVSSCLEILCVQWNSDLSHPLLWGGPGRGQMIHPFFSSSFSSFIQKDEDTNYHQPTDSSSLYSAPSSSVPSGVYTGLR